jgi:undecaprenyl-diphosphatase
LDSLQLVLLALVQGITEFLPISSSAHLILPSQLLGWQDQGLAFDVAVHLGTLLAVLLYFRSTLLGLALGAGRGLLERRSNDELRLVGLLALATAPVVVVGPLLDDLLETRLRSIAVIATTTVLFGLLLWHADRRGGGTGTLADGLSWRGALLVGLAQALALVPGTSRSGVTMTAGLYLNLSRSEASRFSFLLSIPTIAGAGLFKTKDLIESGDPVPWGEMALGAGLAGAAALAVITAFLALIERSGMLPFVIYRLLLGAVLALLAIS